jgi:hypothetical protein
MRIPHKLVLAIPVEMRQEADDVVCLEAHQRLGAIGWFYQDFTQVADQQVIAALARFALRLRSIDQRHDAGRLWEGPAMIKDIVLHLSADAKHDVAAKYAVSVAEAFGANLAAVTFAYEAVLPATSMGGGLPVDFINEQRALAEEAANAAMARLKEMARRTGVAVSRQRVWPGPLTYSAASPAGSICRLSVKPTPMWSGRRNCHRSCPVPVRTTGGGRALHPEDWAHAQSRSSLLGRRASSGARYCGCTAVSAPRQSRRGRGRGD